MGAPLIVSHDVVGAAMAGPGIRYWELARALRRRGHRPTLAAPSGSTFPTDEVNHLVYEPGDRALVEAASSADSLVVTGPILEQFPALKSLAVPIVVDWYDPFLFENLHRLGDAAEGWREYDGGIRTLAEHARCGDFFVCAGERQRDLYLGMLAARGRLNPTTYRADPTFRELIDVVPFGVPTDSPPDAPAARGVLAGIESDDELVVWNGGLWDWLDPETAIRAVARLAGTRPRLRLLFLGTRHPNPAIGEPAAARRARALAAKLGVADRSVLFREWTAYAERGAILRQADLAVSLHIPGVETRYAWRTRLLDCIWCALPVVATEGDAIGDDLAAAGLALAVPPGDDAAVASAIVRLLDDRAGRPERASRFATLAAELSWDRVVEPLDRFCRAPRRAADRDTGGERAPDRFATSIGRAAEWAIELAESDAVAAPHAAEVAGHSGDSPDTLPVALDELRSSGRAAAWEGASANARPAAFGQPRPATSAGLAAWPGVRGTSGGASVAIVNWNGGADLIDCLRALHRQSRPARDILVVDNRSTDGSIEAARHAFPSAAYLELDRNIGFGPAANVAAERTSGDPLVVLNPDVVLAPDWLAATERAFEVESRLGIVGGKLLYPDGTTVQHAGGLLHRPLLLADHRRYRQPDDPEEREPIDVEYVTGAAIAIRRAVLDAIGGFDERFFLYFEETDLCARARQAGWAVRYLPAAVAIHRESVATQRDSEDYFRHYHTGRLRFALKHLSMAAFLAELVPAERARLPNVVSPAELRGLHHAYLAAMRALADPEDTALGGEQPALRPVAADALADLAQRAVATAPGERPGESATARLARDVASRAELHTEPFRSGAPLIGSAIVATRRAWNWMSTRWYLAPILRQQSAINRDLASVAASLDERLAAVERHVDVQAGWLVEEDRDAIDLARRVAALENDVRP